MWMSEKEKQEKDIISIEFFMNFLNCKINLASFYFRKNGKFLFFLNSSSPFILKFSFFKPEKEVIAFEFMIHSSLE